MKDAPKKKKKKKKKSTADKDEPAEDDAEDEEMEDAAPIKTSTPGKNAIQAFDDDDEPREWHGHEKVMMTNLPGMEEPASDGEEQPDYDSMMTPQEMIEARRKAVVKQREADQIKEYHEKLKTTTLATFEDKPDPIESIRVVKTADNFVVIEWDKPCENNVPITCYNIYMSDDSEFQNVEIYDTIDPDVVPNAEEPSNDQRIVQTYTVINLNPNHSYYIKVRAENALGEGYVAKFPQIIMTLDSSMHKPKNLYVWGNNTSSEIGLTDELVE